MGVKQALIKTDEKKFFKYWMEITRPLHKLTPQKLNIIALILYYYFELKKDVNNDDLAWKLTFDHDVKIKIREELNINSDQMYYNILSSLRKDKIIIDNKINKSFIPIVDFKKNKTFSLIYKFEINE